MEKVVAICLLSGGGANLCGGTNPDGAATKENRTTFFADTYTCVTLSARMPCQGLGRVCVRGFGLSCGLCSQFSGGSQVRLTSTYTTSFQAVGKSMMI